MDALIVAAAILALLTLGCLIAKYAPTAGQTILPDPDQPNTQDRVMADLEQFERKNIATTRRRQLEQKMRDAGDRPWWTDGGVA